jgi:hypothetical protein
MQRKRFAKVSEETSDDLESRWIEPDAGISRRRRHRGPGSGNGRDRGTARNLRRRLGCFGVSALRALLAVSIVHVSVRPPCHPDLRRGSVAVKMRTGAHADLQTAAAAGSKARRRTKSSRRKPALISSTAP